MSGPLITQFTDVMLLAALVIFPITLIALAVHIMKMIFSRERAVKPVRVEEQPVQPQPEVQMTQTEPSAE